MPNFSIGDRVIDVNSERKGRVVTVNSGSRRQSYQVQFDNEDSTESVLEGYLQADCDMSDPFERCKNHMFGSYTDFARINTSYKIENSSNSTIASLKASKTVFKSYQFKPLLKFLTSENRRLLVADEVGLGKTIEAGHILLEMQARKELRNALIICPKSLCNKWKGEMEEKFNLKFKIYTRAVDLRADLQQRNGSFRGIINYERFQAPKQADKKKASNPNTFLNIFKESNVSLSIVLCDEAHKFRNASTATYRGMEQMASYAKSMVLLTATPIMISDENLYNLLHVLAPIQFDNNIEFHNSLSLNQPFLQALRELRTDISLADIAAKLTDSKVELQYRFYEQGREEYYRKQIVDIPVYYAENPLYNRCVDLMMSGEDSREIRAKLQFDLTSLSELSSIFSRTRRREITTDWTQAERHPYPISVELEEEERETFDEIIEEYVDDNSYTDEWGDDYLNPGAALGLVTKKRQVASSVYAYLNDDDALDKGIDEYAGKTDAKVELLKNILHEVLDENGEKKIILFAVFKKTLKYLKIRLEKAGYKCAIIYGGMEDRDEELMRFKNSPDVQILLSSEVGSEGLDMQFCSSMVNYDLPWNPMVVEQRIGRIDRFGQKSEVVKIYNFVVKDSIQEDIYTRLLERIGIFRESIGDLEAILDASFNGHESIQEAYTSLEKELFCNKISPEERIRKMEDIAQAVEVEKQQIKRIEESQTNTLTVDSYFQNEVDRILTTHSYLTENELRAYINLLIRKRLPACTLESLPDGTELMHMPKSDRGCIKNFIYAYMPDGDEMSSMYNEFKNRIGDRSEFCFTFSQDVAYDNPDVIFVNVNHPLIQATLRYFNESRNPNERTFVFDVERRLLPEGLGESSYFLCIYSITTSYVVLGAQKDITTQYPVLYDWKNGQIISDQELVYRLMGQSQVYGKPHSATDLASFDDGIINDLRDSLLEHITDYQVQKKDDLLVNLRSQQNIKLSQLDKFHQFQEMARLEDQLRRAKEALRNAWSADEQKKAETNIKSVETRMINVEQEYQEKRLVILRDFELKIKQNLISLNLINII